MKQRAWNICRGRRIIDTVFYDVDCDADYVLRAESDHYGGNIYVRKA
jgi:hypothetical protein